MNASLSFNLPEEKDEHLMAVKAANMFSALYDIKSYLRGLDKYGCDYPDVSTAVFYIRNSVDEIIGNELGDLL